MAKANRKTKVTLPVVGAPVAPAAAPVVKSAYTAPAILLAPAPVAPALAILRASLGVAPQAAPVAPQATVTRGAGVSARTAHTWGRSVPAANKANILLPKVHANFGVSQTITVLVNNPKATGKAPAARFALYGGQGATLTVAAYLAICGKRNIPAQVTNADLMWDFNHGYINVA